MSETGYTEELMELMRYAVRYDTKRVKDGRFKIMENSFDVIAEHPDWEYMVKFGYATKSEDLNGINYRLSDKGIKFLSNRSDVIFTD